MRRSGVGLAVFLAAAVFGLLAGGLSAGEAGTKLLVGHLQVTGHAKLFVAKEKGYFDDEGLDVEMIAYGNSSDGLAALRAGMLDVGSFGTVAPLVYMAAGVDIRIIGGMMGEDAFLVTKPALAAKVKGVEDLRGKRIATVRFSSGDVVLRGALLAAGISLTDDVSITELSGPVAVRRAVANGLVDVGLVWGPHDQLAVADGLRVVMATADLFPGHPCCRVVVTKDRFSGMSGDVWPRFLRAVLRAGKFCKDPSSRDELMDIIMRYVDVDKTVVENGYYHGRLDQTTDPHTDSVLQVWEILKKAGIIHSERQLERFIEIGPYREALESLAAAEPDEQYWQDALNVFKSRNLAAKGGGM